jgi:hypothetical protein
MRKTESDACYACGGVQHQLFGMRTCCARSMVVPGISGFVIGYNEEHWGIVGKYRRDNRPIISDNPQTRKYYITCPLSWNPTAAL